MGSVSLATPTKPHTHAHESLSECQTCELRELRHAVARALLLRLYRLLPHQQPEPPPAMLSHAIIGSGATRLCETEHDHDVKKPPSTVRRAHDGGHQAEPLSIPAPPPLGAP